MEQLDYQSRRDLKALIDARTRELLPHRIRQARSPVSLELRRMRQAESYRRKKRKEWAAMGLREDGDVLICTDCGRMSMKNNSWNRHYANCLHAGKERGKHYGIG